MFLFNLRDTNILPSFPPVSTAFPPRLWRYRLSRGFFEFECRAWGVVWQKSTLLRLSLNWQLLPAEGKDATNTVAVIRLTLHTVSLSKRYTRNSSHETGKIILVQLTKTPIWTLVLFRLYQPSPPDKEHYQQRTTLMFLMMKLLAVVT